MKTLVILLILALALETYGIYGASQAQHVYYNCTLEVGPLCFSWEENALGKLMGKNKSQDLEDALLKARRDFEREMTDKLVEAKKQGASLQKVVDDAKKGLEKLEDKLKDAAK